MSLQRILKAHTDNGGDLRSVPISLLDDLVTGDQPLELLDEDFIFMLVCQKRKYDKKKPAAYIYKSMDRGVRVGTHLLFQETHKSRDEHRERFQHESENKS
jgi:hypothetical protein